MCITTSNVSVNNQMVQEIEIISPKFKAETHAIGCMAHIIHLAPCDGLNALGHGVSAEIEVNQKSNEVVALMEISNLINPPDVQHMRYDSIISCIAWIASYMKQSTQIQEKCIGTVILLYDGSQPANTKTLLTPVSTQWDSTYYMIKCALILKDACKQFFIPASMETY
ncbi:hypothetical protein O181_027383 [Austropuccinia psidii MF-1]|uniref:Uncharacterized protein n=1 Tax=Austropuccinia psidii MF-1 TaxID=1389203 RepID=A0A9Q3CPH3_9BASI|nr:hypothetical protein [Austropuccinia psidii MF-1]